MNSAEILKYIRKIENIKTQEEFANLLKIKPSVIKNIEAGNQKMSDDLAERISEKLGYNFVWLKLGKGTPKQEKIQSTEHYCQMLMEAMNISQEELEHLFKTKSAVTVVNLFMRFQKGDKNAIAELKGYLSALEDSLDN